MDEEATEEEKQEAPVFLVVQVLNILLSIFSDVEKYINNHQIYNCNWLYANKFCNSKNFKGPSLNTREFCTVRVKTMKNLRMKVWKHFCLKFFSQGEWNCVANPRASCCIVNWGLTLSPLLNRYIQLWKLGYDYTQPHLISAWLATTPTLVSVLLIFYFTLFVILWRMIIRRSEWTCLLILLWSSTIWKLLQRLSSFLPDKTSSVKKTFSSRLQFVGLPSQWRKTLHSLDQTLKIHSGINIFISDKLEHSEEVSQSETLMLLAIVAFTLRQWKQWTFKKISLHSNW